MGITHAVSALDRAVFLAVNHGVQSPVLDRVMPAVTDLGLGYVQALAVLAAAVFLGMRNGEVRLAGALGGLSDAVRRRRAWVGPLLLAIVVSGLGSDAIKGAFGRARPWWFYEQEHKSGRYLDVQVRTVPGVYPLKVHGFPSGHTATSVALATTLTLLYMRWRRHGAAVAVAWALALAIAFSRLYLASHWPLDLLGGAALGVLAGVLGLRMCEAWARRHRAVAGLSDASGAIARSRDHPVV